MSDYTPTTGIVKGAYMIHKFQHEHVELEGSAAGFDRWLAERIRDQVHSAVEYAAQLKAAERFIESEQARRGDETSLADIATGDEDRRVEEWSRKAAHVMAQSACDEELSQSHEVIAILAERLIPRGRALVGAGWTPPTNPV